MILLLTIFLGCQEADPCAAMCSIATRRLGGCMEGDGLIWEDAGYDGPRDFFHSCETWAWVSRKLETDAGTPGATNKTCEDWESLLEDEHFACEDFFALDWNSTP